MRAFDDSTIGRLIGSICNESLPEGQETLITCCTKWKKNDEASAEREEKLEEELTKITEIIKNV